MSLKNDLPEWEGLLLHLDIRINDNFTEANLQRFVADRPNISHCMKVCSIYHYCLDVRLRLMDSYENFRNEIMQAVPGITSINAGVVIHYVG